MKKMYGVDSTGFVYFKCYIDFYRGGEYCHEGLLTLDEYYDVIKLFSKKGELYLEEVNGKHSDVSASIDDFKFYNGNCETEKEVVEKYIVENDKQTDFEYFLEGWDVDDQLGHHKLEMKQKI